MCVSVDLLETVFFNRERKMADIDTGAFIREYMSGMKKKK